MPSEKTVALHATLRTAAAALRDAGVPFAVGGGLACWVHGAPSSDHDVDIMVKPEDAEVAQKVLVQAGMKPVTPEEDWLLKAYDGDVLVDLIFRPAGMEITDEVLARCEERDVEAIRMRVMRPTDVLLTKLLALNEQNLDYRPLLQTARAVREQIDWEDLWSRTWRSPFARAFRTLVQEMEIVPQPVAKAG